MAASIGRRAPKSIPMRSAKPGILFLPARASHGPDCRRSAAQPISTPQVKSGNGCRGEAAALPGKNRDRIVDTFPSESLPVSLASGV
jgi:hypothetical protein